jgi:hypothetical protein
MTMIVGLSGKKQAGKDTICEDFLFKIRISDSKYPCKIYSFADPLKKFCIEVLGLTYNQCYGTDAEKDSLTNYSWGNILGDHGKTGIMTAREVLQYFGTEICKKMFGDDIWIKATMKEIRKDNNFFAFIADVRFLGEVNSILNKKGVVIRLTRDVCEVDDHSSEKALDDYDFESTESCFILDNKNMSLREQREVSSKVLDDVLKSHYEEHLKKASYE